MANVKISDMSAAASLTGSEIVPIVQSGANYTATAQQIADLGGGGGYTELTGTLTAGNTSITLSDASITTSSTIDIYTSVYGVNPTAATDATGSVTLTFEAQAGDISVKVRIS